MAGRYRVADRAQRTAYGITFDSKAEAERYLTLKMMERAGDIRNIERQPSFTLQEAFTHPSGEKVREIVYRADFEYFCNETQRRIVEDVKGHKTDIYRLKRKLFLKRYPDVVFREV